MTQSLQKNLSDWKNIDVERFRAVEISTRKISIKKKIANTVRLNITDVTETGNLRIMLEKVSIRDQEN